MDAEDKTVRLASLSESEECHLPGVSTHVTAAGLLCPQDWTGYDILTCATLSTWGGPPGSETGAAAPGAATTLLPPEEQTNQEDSNHNQWQHYGSEGLTLNIIKYFTWTWSFY